MLVESTGRGVDDAHRRENAHKKWGKRFGEMEKIECEEGIFNVIEID